MEVALVPGLMLAGWMLVVTPVENDIHIDMTGGRLSVEAVRTSLGALLGELDRMAGTESTLPPELESYRVSVRFSGVPFAEAVTKLFEGLKLDYAVVGGTRIVVLAESQDVVPTPVARPASVRAGGSPGTGAFRQFAPLPTAAPSTTVGSSVPFQRTPPSPGGGVASPGSVPGPGAVLPFGAPASSGPRVDQPRPGFIGNTQPAMLDLNRGPSSEPLSDSSPTSETPAGPASP